MIEYSDDLKATLSDLNGNAIIELFSIEYEGNTVFFHSGKNELKENIVFNGISYTAYPVEATGFEVKINGTLPRPKLLIANVDGLMSGVVSEMDNLLGAKFIRKRTFIKYLDAINFKNGNSNNSIGTYLMPDVYFINSKKQETKLVIEFELVSYFDFQGVILPRRKIIIEHCSWRYRGVDCTYSGSPVCTLTNQLIDNSLPYSERLELDKCSKSLYACKLRFPSGSLPYGGFLSIAKEYQ